MAVAECARIFRGRKGWKLNDTPDESRPAGDVESAAAESAPAPAEQAPKRRKRRRSRWRRRGGSPNPPIHTAGATDAGRSEGARTDPANPRGRSATDDNAVVPNNGGDAPADKPVRRRRNWPRPADGPIYGALDLGTNNCRLLMATPLPRGRFRVVDAFSRIIRLGEGISHTGRLTDAAMDRAIEALSVCRGKMDGRRVRRSRLIATEACRRAENGSEFLTRVEDETGLRLEVVDRRTEARLAVAGCASLVHPQADGVILFDIGGGSSELVWLDFRNRGGNRHHGLSQFIRAWTSLPIGVVSLSEHHGGVHVTRPIFEDMVAEVRVLLQDFPQRAALADLLDGGHVHLLGTSGTVTTLSGVHLGLDRYDRRRVDGTWMSTEEVAQMIDLLLSMSYEERVASPCIGADRADLVLAGCAILEAVRREWPCDRLRVADRGLREGILTELMVADGAWSGPRKKRRRKPRKAPTHD